MAFDGLGPQRHRFAGWRTRLAGTPATISVSDSAVTVFRGRTRSILRPFALARACTFCIQLPVTVAKIGSIAAHQGECVQNVP